MQIILYVFGINNANSKKWNKFMELWRNANNTEPEQFQFAIYKKNVD